MDLNPESVNLTEGGNKYSCQFCNEGFDSKMVLKDHIITAHELQKRKQTDSFYPGDYSKMLKCEIKEEPSETSSNLGANVSKLKIFSCEFCDQNFSRKWDLRSHHLSVHKDIEIPAQISYEQPYKCDFCPKGIY